jgi:hypothetical protein
MGAGTEVADHAHGRDGPGSRVLGAGWPVLLAVAAAACWLVRWVTAAPRGTGDAFWYTRLAYTYLGASPDEATARAAAFVERLGIEGRAAATALVQTMDPRYPAIFAGRPWFPATGAVLIPVAGPDGMTWSAAVAGVLAGGVLGWFAARMTGSRAAGLAALVLFYLLPSGQFAAQVMADPWALAFWVCGLAATSLYLDRGGNRSLLALGLLTLLLGISKSANGIVLAVTVAGSAVLIVMAGRRTTRLTRHRAIVAALVAAPAAALVIVSSGALGLPGLDTSIQDLLTAHFGKPDVSSPYTALLALDARRTPAWVSGLVGAPGLLLLLAAGGAGLLRRPAPWVVPWLVGPAACILLPLAHPVSSEIPRMMSPVWASVALGLASWVPALGWLRVRARAGADVSG